MNYQFDSEEAEQYGVDEAIMVSNLRFWIQKNQANGRHFYEGRTWTYNKLEAFTELMPFWTEKQIRRIIDSLVGQEVILKGNFNSTAYDRTCWYAFLDESKSLNRHIQMPKRANGNAQTGTPIPDSNTDSNTDVLAATKEAPLLPTKKSRKTNLKKPFSQSQFQDLTYTTEYFQGTDLAQVNWAYYLPKIQAWSEKKEVKRDEQGWRDTIENWLQKDINKNCVRTVRDTKPGEGTADNPKTLKGEAYFDYYGGLNPNFKQPNQ
jgi:hypothetical protein